MASILAAFLVVLAFAGVGADTAAAAVTDRRVERIVARLNALNASSSDRADRYWSTLSPEQQAAVTDALAVVDVVVEVTEDAASEGAPPEAFIPEASDETQFSAQACYGPNIRTAVGSNRLGVTVFKYSQSLQARTSGNAISGAWCSDWASNLAWGYSCNDHSSYRVVTFGGLWWNTIKYYSQGSISFCAVWCDNYGPWVARQFAADGGYWRWSGW